MSARRYVWLVMRRELREGIRGRQFLVSTIVLLLLLGGIVGLQALFGNDRNTVKLGIGGQEPPRLASALDAAAKPLDAHVELQRYATPEAARAAVAHGKVEAAFVDDGHRLLTREDTSGTASTISAVAARGLFLSEQAESVGITPAQARSVLVSPLAVDQVRSAGSSGSEGFAFAATILLFVSVSIYGQQVLMSTVQEKASRIVEVLLATLRPRHLLAGKVAGVGLLGLFQLALVVVGVLAAGLAGAIDLPSFGRTAPLVVLWFLLGFTLYAVAFAAAGALISRIEDASVATPITMVMLAAYLTSFAALRNPDGALAVVLTLVPVSAPFTIPGRAAVTTVPAWQQMLAVVLMLLAIWLLVRVAGRIYELGLLRIGPRVPFREAYQAARRATA